MELGYDPFRIEKKTFLVLDVLVQRRYKHRSTVQFQPSSGDV